MLLFAPAQLYAHTVQVLVTCRYPLLPIAIGTGLGNLGLSKG
jgi:hypothetical protein